MWCFTYSRRHLSFRKIRLTYSICSRLGRISLLHFRYLFQFRYSNLTRAEPLQMSRLLVLSLKSSACASACCIVSVCESIAPGILVYLRFICLLRCLAYSIPHLVAKIGLVALFGFSTKVLKVYYSSNTVNHKHTDT
jgi:hypothetical protein